MMAAVSRKPRKKGGLACLYCRDRKLKCTGRPVCTACQMKKLECTFVARITLSKALARSDIIQSRTHRIANMVKKLDRTSLPEEEKANYKIMLMNGDVIPKEINELLADINNEPSVNTTFVYSYYFLASLKNLFYSWIIGRCNSKDGRLDSWGKWNIQYTLESIQYFNDFIYYWHFYGIIGR